MSNKNLLLHFRTGQRLAYPNFWVYCYCSSNKTDMVQLFKNIFAFIGVKFQDYSKKFESLLSISRIFTFSLIQEYQFNDHFVRFQHFGLHYHILIVSPTCVNIRADSEWISAVQRWKSNVSEQKKISSEQRWFRENQSWSALKQSWSALMFTMFSESALKNVKTMKQQCSALITSGTSTRVAK